jgi:hypothetical protein
LNYYTLWKEVKYLYGQIYPECISFCFPPVPNSTFDREIHSALVWRYIERLVDDHPVLSIYNAYAYWLVGLGSRKKQNRIQLLLLIGSMIGLAAISLWGSSPITLDVNTWVISPQRLIQAILKWLCLLVGLPDFVCQQHTYPNMVYPSKVSVKGR